MPAGVTFEEDGDTEIQIDLRGGEAKSVLGKGLGSLTEPLLGNGIKSDAGPLPEPLDFPVSTSVQAASSEDEAEQTSTPGNLGSLRPHRRRKGLLDSESLDYEFVQNGVFMQRLKREGVKKEKKRIYGYTGRTFAKFVITLVTGIIIGLIALGISILTGKFIDWKNRTIVMTPRNEWSFVQSMFLHMAYSSVLVLVGIGMVQFWAPAATGAGVSLVIAYLNGNHVPHLFSFASLITKFVGTICAISANLFMGPEGPMVHMGAAVASVVTYMECTLTRPRSVPKLMVSHSGLVSGPPVVEGSPGPIPQLGSRSQEEARGPCPKFWEFMMDLSSDLDRREFLSAGAAAGIASAFGAPVGGVLFSMEEASTYWSRKVAWRCFLCAVAAVMTMNGLHLTMVSNEWKTFCKDNDSCDGMLSFAKGPTLRPQEWLYQTPAILGISVIAGLLGVAFNTLRIKLWRFRASRKNHALRLAEGVCLAAITVAVMYLLSKYAGTCSALPNPHKDKWGPIGAYVRFGCEDAQPHNDLASAFLASPEITIRRLFSLDMDPEGKSKKAVMTGLDSQFSVKGLAVFVPAYLVVMGLGSGTAIPGGLFMPAIMLGAAAGALFGRGIMYIGMQNVHPGFYAFLGATGCLASVFRSPISLVVIVIEGTRKIDYLFGVILAVVTSNWVAQHVHRDGVYESEIERAGNVHFLRPEPPRAVLFKTAGMIMAADVQGFAPVEKVSRVLKVLKDTNHNGFPVFADARPGSGAGGELEGLILRSQLLVLLRRQAFCHADGTPIWNINEEELDAEMRRFYRIHHTHHRFMVTSKEMLESLDLEWVNTLHSPPRVREGGAAEEGRPPWDGAGRSPWDGAGRSPKPARHVYVDLRPYMNLAPLTVREECNAGRVYQAFTSLGLRHLCVVNSANRVVGIITRKDLDHAAGHGWWRTSKIAPSPERDGPLFKSMGKGLARRVQSLWRSRGSSENNLPGIVKSGSEEHLGSGLLEVDQRAKSFTQGLTRPFSLGR
eukprot:evm.model.scf_1330.4 EVM.evm.TU.scf_1330.4   scf_1330:35334-42870(-)